MKTCNYQVDRKPKKGKNGLIFSFSRHVRNFICAVNNIDSDAKAALAKAYQREKGTCVHASLLVA